MALAHAPALSVGTEVEPADALDDVSGVDDGGRPPPPHPATPTATAHAAAPMSTRFRNPTSSDGPTAR